MAFYLSRLSNSSPLSTPPPNTHTPSLLGFFIIILGEIYSSFFHKDTKHSGGLFYFFPFFSPSLCPRNKAQPHWNILHVSPYEGLNHHLVLTDSTSHRPPPPPQPCFLSGPGALTRGGLVPSWPGRATQCRVPTSTASRSPPTPTSSRTCWEACLLRRCQACPSAATAPRHQPVSRRYAVFC